MKIVSANYRDRKAKKRWLVREEDEPPSKAKAFESVYATGVTFRASSAYEDGFGCTIVAYCETAEGDGKVPAEVQGFRLHFYVQWFKNARTLEVVRTCDELVLKADGAMFATVKVEAATEDVATT